MTSPLDLTPAEQRYLFDLERKIKRILAAYEAMSPREKPGLAQFNWPEGDRVPDYYGNDLQIYMLQVWGPEERASGYQSAHSHVDRLLAEVGRWAPIQRKLWWARLSGAKWKDLHHLLGKRYPRKVIVHVYDVLLLKAARALTK